MVVIETIGQQRLLSQSQRVDWCSLKMLWYDVTASQKIIKVQHHNHWCVRQAANWTNMDWPYRLINLWLLFPKWKTHKIALFFVGWWILKPCHYTAKLWESWGTTHVVNRKLFLWHRGHGWNLTVKLWFLRICGFSSCCLLSVIPSVSSSHRITHSPLCTTFDGPLHQFAYMHIGGKKK